jgi:serine/threonine-protein kinase RsbW
MTKQNESCCDEMLVSSDPSVIWPMQQRLIALMQSNAYGGRDVWSVRLAFEEGLNNAMKHASGQIRVAFRVEDNRVWIEIEDGGDGFCPQEVADPRLPEYLERPGGRGVLLMRSFMSTVEYNQRGNRVTMQKFRSNV